MGRIQIGIERRKPLGGRNTYGKVKTPGREKGLQIWEGGVQWKGDEA